MHLSFERNLGNVDRTIRIVVGIILLYVVFATPLTMSGWVVSILGILGAAMIIEGILGY